LAIFADVSIKIPAAFRNPMIWVTVAFKNSLVTALAVFNKISRK
jgi:hypothetical protein